MIENPQELDALVGELSRSAWTLSAIATLFESKLADALREPRRLDEIAARVDSLPRERIARCLDVLAARGVVAASADGYKLAPGAMSAADQPRRTAFIGEMRSTLMQTLAAVDAASGGAPARGWYHTDPRLLQAQGDASANFAYGLAGHLVHQLGDLGARLAAPSARFLDVGVGVAALSIAMCRAFPSLRVVGLDVFDVPLGLARSNVRRAAFEDRIELRQLAIEDLRDEAAFDLVWLPAFFLAPSSIPVAIDRARAALREGGWLLMPMLDPDVPEPQSLVYSMVLEQWGAVADSTTILGLLQERGFAAPRRMATPSWLSLAVAQR